MQKDNIRHHIHLHFLVFIAGFTAILGKLITNSPFSIVWHRMFIALIVIFLFALLIVGIIRTSLKALELGKLFQGLLAFGAGILIAIQVVFNIGVNLGILPTKGLTLPFISYGGTSLIIFMFLMGLVLRINFENKSIK